MAKGREVSPMMILISSTVLVILAVAFLSAIADQTALNTKKTTVDSEAHALIDTAYTNKSVNTTVQYTVTNAPTSWKIEDCPITSVSIQYYNGTSLTETTDYVFNYTYGTYALKDTKPSQQLSGSYNKSYVDYSYCSDNYMSNNWGRTVLDTNVGIYAISILAIVILLVYTLLKETED